MKAKPCDESVHIGAKIRILSNLIRRKTFNFIQDKYKNVMGSQGFIIKFLAEKKDSEVFQKDIEKEFKLRRSTVTATLNRMESANLIERQSVQRDNRLKKISLTEKGLSLHKDIESEILKTETSLKSVLTDCEIKKFFEIANKLQEKLEEGEQL